MVQAYWPVGCLIVENEQEGQGRAEYGKAVLQELSHRLTREFGKGFSFVARQKRMRFEDEDFYIDLVLNNLPWGRVTETYLPIPINAGGPFQYANARSRRELH